MKQELLRSTRRGQRTLRILSLKGDKPKKWGVNGDRRSVELNGMRCSVNNVALNVRWVSAMTALEERGRDKWS